WQRLAWTYEVDCGVLVADALAMVRNIIIRETAGSFVEMDMAESGNRFDKVQKYNNLYGAGRWESTWWAKELACFPRVLIITTSNRRVEMIRCQVETENCHGIRFEVKLLEEVKAECLKSGG
ncbi:MAG: hypothetical protein ABSC17_11490, partial [Thermacetogeniaceae bacterium]